MLPRTQAYKCVVTTDCKRYRLGSFSKQWTKEILVNELRNKKNMKTSSGAKIITINKLIQSLQVFSVCLVKIMQLFELFNKIMQLFELIESKLNLNHYVWTKFGSLHLYSLFNDYWTTFINCMCYAYLYWELFQFIVCLSHGITTNLLINSCIIHRAVIIWVYYRCCM